MAEEDPVVCYLIVRESLNMSGGKIAAQCGHAVEYLLLKYFKIQLFHSMLKNRTDFDLEKVFSKEDDEHVRLTNEWIEHASTKIVKRADDKEWEKLKQEWGKNCFIIKDAGKTEIAPGSETVMVLWPQHKSQTTKLVKRLRLL